MGRVRRDFERPEDKRLAKLIIIATEGRKTERIYFEALAEFYESKNIHVKVLEKLDNNSSPESVFEQLNEFSLEYKLDENDELWMVIDRDYQSWEEQAIKSVAQMCYQKKGFFLALSNPAFELWLLLHFVDCSELEIEEKERMFQNRRVSRSKTYMKKAVGDQIGGFNESKYDPMIFIPHAKRAINNSKKLDEKPNSRWPNFLGTRVHRLTDKIIKGG